MRTRHSTAKVLLLLVVQGSPISITMHPCDTLIAILVACNWAGDVTLKLDRSGETDGSNALLQSPDLHGALARQFDKSAL